MIFLEVAHTTPEDIHLNIKDVVYFVSFVVTLLTAWFKLKHDNDKQTDQIKHLKEMAKSYKKDCDVSFMNSKHSRLCWYDYLKFMKTLGTRINEIL